MFSLQLPIIDPSNFMESSIAFQLRPSVCKMHIEIANKRSAEAMPTAKTWLGRRFSFWRMVVTMAFRLRRIEVIVIRMRRV